MRTARFPNGEKRFNYKTYLRPQQIKGHFSKICASLKYGTKDPTEEQLDEVADETSAILNEQATTQIIEAINEQPAESETMICPLEVCTNLLGNYLIIRYELLIQYYSYLYDHGHGLPFNF